MAENRTGRPDTIARNTVYMFIRMVLVALIGFYTSRIILKTLGVEDFGVYNIVGSVVVFLSFFKNALTNATYRHFTFELGAGNSGLLAKTFSMSMNVHLILAAAIAVILEAAGPWIIREYLNIPADRTDAAVCLFHFSLAVFCLEIIKTPYNSSIIAHERMNFYAVTSIIEVLLKLGIVFLLVWIPFDKLILYGMLLAAVSVIMFTWYRLYCRRNFKETVYRPYWSRPMLKRLTSYAGWSMVVNAADVTAVQFMNIFMNIFGGVTINAAMGVANQVNSLVGNFLHTFTNSFNPQIIKSYARQDMGYFMKLLFSTSKISFYLFFMAAFPIMLNIGYLLDIWLVNPPEGTETFVCLILLYSLFDSFSISLWNAVHATGNIKVHQILMASIKILNIPAAYILLETGMPVYSAVAVYAALNGVCAVVRILYLRKLINFPSGRYFNEVTLKIAAVTALSIWLPLWSMSWEMSGLMHLAVSSGIFLALYIASVYTVGLDDGEKAIARRLISNVLKRRKSD